MSTLGDTKDLVTAVVVGGIAFLAYKVAKDLGWLGPKDPKDPKDPDKPPGTIIPTGVNPVLDYVAQQSPLIQPTQQDLSKLTPTVQVPFIGPVGLGVPSILSGTVAQIANSVSVPIMGAVWQWSMDQKFGQDWESRMKWTDGKGWVPLSVNDKTATTAIAAMGPAKDFSSIVLKPTASAAIGPTMGGGDKVTVAIGATTSQSMGGTGSEIKDTPGILDYINIGPAKPSELDPKYRPAAPVPEAPSTTYYKAPDGSAQSSTPIAGFIPVTVQNLIPTKTEPPKPVTIPAPPAREVQVAPTLPSYQNQPAGYISYNWQTGTNSTLVMTGPGWYTISIAEAKSRGLIK